MRRSGIIGNTVLAEIGPNMAVFPTAAHLASWAGMCPGQRDSAGKHGSGKTRKGSKWLRAALVQSARSASQSEGTYLSERYRQITRRRRDAKAIIAVGHEILLATYTDPRPHHLQQAQRPTPDWPSRPTPTRPRRPSHHRAPHGRSMGISTSLTSGLF